MRAIFLYGHAPTVAAAYRHADALLRQEHVQNIVLAMVATVDEDTASSLRQAGGELWRCAPEDGPADCDAETVKADRELLAATWHELAARTAAAVYDFLGTVPVAA